MLGAMNFVLLRIEGVRLLGAAHWSVRVVTT